MYNDERKEQKMKKENKRKVSKKGNIKMAERISDKR